MFRHNLCTLLLLTVCINHSLSKLSFKCKIDLTYINSVKYPENNAFKNNFKDIINQNNDEDGAKIKEYTLNNNPVLYLKKSSSSNEKRESSKKSSKTPKKKAASTVGEVKDEEEEKNLENEEELEEKDGQKELLISNRMLNSVLSLTSTLYVPSLYDIIPILYNIKDDVLVISETMEDQFKMEKKNLDKKKKIHGMFITNEEGGVENLLISIPSSILDRLIQSSKYGHKVESTDSPLQLITLGRGFLTKVYEMTILPYLAKISLNSLSSELDQTHGFMEYIKSSSKDDRSYKEYDYKEIHRVKKEEFDEVFKDFSPVKSKNMDTSGLSEKALKSLSDLLKCAKDMAYFNSCLILLERLLGRKPTDTEILYSFDVEETKEGDEPTKKIEKHLRNKLVDIINYSEREIDHRIDGFFTPMVELAIEHFEKRMEKENYYFKILLSCLKDGIAGMRRRIFGVHPRMINLLQKYFVGHLFKVAYSQVKLSAIRQNLPIFLPLSTMRLAKKAFLVYRHLQTLMENILLRYKNKMLTRKSIKKLEFMTKSDDKKKTSIEISREAYEEYIKQILKVEDHFSKRGGDQECNEYMKRQHLEKLLRETVAKVLNVTVDRMSEAVDSYKTKEVRPTDKFPKHMRPRKILGGELGRMTGAYIDFVSNFSYNEDAELQKIKDTIYIRTMRKLAVEAIQDRLPRLLFMARNNLLVDVENEYEKVLENLQIPRKTADFIVFTATLLCKQYEVWRIRLNLPPYVNEFHVDPRVLRFAPLDPSNLPYHISSAVYNEIKRNINSAVLTDVRTYASSRGPRHIKKDTLNRMRQIRPNLSTPNELLMNYKANYKDYEKILQRSPMYYLRPSGVMEE